jgi:hypothetical protein
VSVHRQCVLGCRVRHPQHLPWRLAGRAHPPLCSRSAPIAQPEHAPNITGFLQSRTGPVVL